MYKELIKDEIYLRTVIDSIPMPIFIMDSDLKIIDLNNQSLEFFRPDEDVVLSRLCGEILHCLNALESEEKCGDTEFCPDCVIRNAVKKSYKGNKVFRQKYDMRLKINGSTQSVTFLITASPFRYNDGNYSLLALEDITELMELRRLIPICSSCKKIRDDKGLWESVESYFHKYSSAKFTHSICPDCSQKLYPQLYDKK